jgi:large subunit ribosomal protein L24
MKIKTGDKVRIIAGKDKGKEGKVLQVFPENERVVVEDANMLTKHLKKTGGRPGQKIKFAAPIHVSNVRLVSEKSGATGRVGYKTITSESGEKKIRVLRSKGKTEDIE